MSSNLPLPCAIRSLPSSPIPAKQPAAQVVLEIDGAKDGDQQIYSTLDLVEGNAIVSVSREVDLGDIDITFEGNCSPLCLELAI